MAVHICTYMAPYVACAFQYIEYKYGGPLGRLGTSCAKAGLVRPQ